MIDPFTIKPLDSKTIIDNAKATRGRIITVEDHYYEGKGAVFCAASVPEQRMAGRKTRGRAEATLQIRGVRRR